VPYEKNRVTEKERVRGTWLDAHGTNADATSELKQIFGVKPFETPKPGALIEWFASLHSNDDAIVMDSFAGSGTTAHAVMKLNAKDGGQRKFILVQIPEILLPGKPAHELGFKEVVDVTAERVRRVIRGYKFSGTQREELMRESITFTALKKSAQILENADSFDLLDKQRFDRIVKKVEDGALVVTGEKDITEKTDGLGGSFTFAELGPEMSLDKLLTDGLPTFDALAKYVFFTATGRTLNDVPAQKAKSHGFIGETDVYRVHLHYKPEKGWLQGNDAALTEKLLDEMLATNAGKKRLLVFAAAKFMSQRDLSKKGAEFCQLPYAIHRILGD
jgi:adenine-specific DNA-methyltransferase